jgi:hypothetical protein
MTGMTTTMKVSVRNRDRLAAIASSELGGGTLDSALEMLLLEHESPGALAHLSPAQLAEICREAGQLAKTDIAGILDA